MFKEFARLRVAIRNGLWRGAGIPSNPGWTDDDIIAGLEAWAELTYNLRTAKKIELKEIEKYFYKKLNKI